MTERTHADLPLALVPEHLLTTAEGRTVTPTAAGVVVEHGLIESVDGEPLGVASRTVATWIVGDLT